MSPKSRSFRKGNAGVSSRSSTSTSLRISTSITLFITIALACIVGSEYDQANHQSRTSRSGIPFFQSVQRYFGGFHRVATSSDSKRLLTDDQVDAYNRNGFVVVSGLLDSNEMKSLVDAGEDVVSKHIDMSGDKGPSKGNFQVHEFGLVLNDKRFRDVALHSRLPRVAAELLQLDRQSQNLRVLKDVFLAKGHESTSSCGWHVDDQLFWPAAYQLPTRSSVVDQSGVNAWIALDDMPIENGASMAVSPASHIQDFSWRSEAFAALNFDDKFGNGVSKDDLIDMIKSGKVDSCGLEKVAPHVYDDIELSKQEFNFKRGDVIFMNRWLFHKTTAATEKGKLARSGGALLKRFSVRYVTGSTSLPEGFTTELSVLSSDGLNLGKKLNEVSGEWYPKCWPKVEADADERLEHLTSNELPVAKEKLGVIMAELMSLFQSK